MGSEALGKEEGAKVRVEAKDGAKAGFPEPNYPDEPNFGASNSLKKSAKQH